MWLIVTNHNYLIVPTFISKMDTLSEIYLSVCEYINFSPSITIAVGVIATIVGIIVSTYADYWNQNKLECNYGDSEEVAYIPGV